ncbi:MAG: hypothetical protein NZ554_14050, partial [Bryobacteraceae bacterium]|nr:hypothetical protein [Bryobacteraceae bacterium]
MIEAYIETLPSDRRFVVGFPEAIENRLRGVASAKQTPQETAARLRAIASRIEEAVEKARASGAGEGREWAASEPDLLTLARLARYHAQKQLAAYELAWRY